MIFEGSWINENWMFLILYIVLGLVALWLLYLITTLIFASIFKGTLIKASPAINLLLNQRYEIMVSFIKLLEKAKIKVDPKDKKEIGLLERIDDFQSLSKEERDSRVLGYVHGSHNILNLALKNKDLLKEDELNRLNTLFEECESNYRQKVASYNSNVVGYNYWISTILVRFVYRLFKKKPVDQIV